MIKYIENHKIDRQKWDNCISSAINGNIFGYSWYLDIAAENWDALVANDYEAVFPLPKRKKWSVEYIFRPFLIQCLGVYSANTYFIQQAQEFIDAIPAKFRFVEVFLNKYNVVNNSPYKLTQNITFELDLITSYDKIYKNYSQNNKRNIKKAQSAFISITENVHPDEIIKLFRNNRGKNIKNLTDLDYIRLKKLVYKLISKGMIHIRAAYTRENNLCAGAFFLESHQKIIFLFSAVSDEGRQFGAMSLLIDQFIKENCQKSITFDFEGSNNKNLARFYQGFGSKECVYLRVEKNKLPWCLKWAYNFYRNLKK